MAIHSAVIRGAEALPVSVEVSVSSGIPGITIVGMPDTAVLDARFRVRCALQQSGFEIPRAHVTVNLAPGELKKTGTSLDLPIAVAILVGTRQIPPVGIDGCLLVGELALDGRVCPVRGEVAHALLAAHGGLALVHSSQGAKGPIVSEDERTINQLSDLRRGIDQLPQSLSGATPPVNDENGVAHAIDYADVADQEVAKRALMIAAAGGHGVLMMGPPGAGKTMLARRMPTILPPLTGEERIEAMLLHSVAGQSTHDIERSGRPFRAPHHSVSRAGLIGGGNPVKPGEISLAHRGVLFLDELNEFSSSVLQSLRQPLEDHRVCLVRAEGNYVFPADFLLVAAANPCPCGHLGDPGHQCTCPPARVQSYQAKIGGPLMDRIDVFVDVARPASHKVINGGDGLSSSEMAQRVAEAVEFALWRVARSSGTQGRGIERYGLDRRARSTLEGLADRKALGGRGIDRVARVARTIADLAGRELVGVDDVVEACSYRPRDE